MQAKAGIYLDANAGAPLKTEVVEALLPFLSREYSLVPNPSSIHFHGRQAKRALAEAREKVALSLGDQVDPEQLIFTSSGTEANQLAIRSIFEPLLAQGKRPHWITTEIEHDSNRQMVNWLLERGGSVSYFPVDSQGIPRIEAFWDLARAETALVSFCWVNNETGVISDVHKLGQFTQQRSIPLHLDGAQAWGKLPITLSSQFAPQFLSLSGHKIGGLNGVGVLWVNRGVPVRGILLGKQEKGRRGGTENLLGIVSMGAAASSLKPLIWADRVRPLRDRLEQEICKQISGVFVNGGSAPRVANTLNLSFDGIEGEGLVMALDLAGYSVSSGSACASGALEPSHVLLAMGRTKAQAMAAIRVSLFEEIPWAHLEGFCIALENAVCRMRKSELIRRN